MSSSDHSLQNESEEGPAFTRRFKFIAVSGTETHTNRESLRQAHSHAQAEYRRQSRRLRQQAGREQAIHEQPPHDAQVQLVPEPVTYLGAGRSDPFQTFHLGDNPRVHRLWDHVYDGTCPKFRVMIAIGFIDLVRESIGRTQMLSASAWHLVHWMHIEDDSGDADRYSIISTQTLQARLNSLTTGFSDEVITAVLASAAYANMIKEPQIFQIHMDGLDQILRHRGGVHTLDSNAGLRMGLFWIEVNGRCRQDAAPLYPLPIDLLARKSKLELADTQTPSDPSHDTVGTLSQSYAVHVNLQQLRGLTIILEGEALTRDLWYDPLFAAYHVSPVLHSFLSIEHGSVFDDLAVRQKECFRLAGILYLCNLRSKSDFEPGAGMLYGTKIQMMLGTPYMLPYWEEANIFLIWIMTVCACSPILFEDTRNQFTLLLSECIQAAGITSFADFETSIKGFVWCDAAFGQVLHDLGSLLQI